MCSLAADSGVPAPSQPIPECPTPLGRRRSVRLPSAESGVGVQAVEVDVDDGEVEDHRGDADEVEHRDLRRTPAARGASMQVGGVDDPHDESPDLLRVPAPVAAPGHLRPDGTGDEGEGPGDEADGRDRVGDPLDRKSTRLNSSHVAISYAV